MTERADDPQLAALRAFIFLSSLRDDWGGALIVACGLGSGGSALSIAANISGAGCLAIDERPEVTRAAMRSGACDFVVNTVDEALRILKNEIRQRKPVSVGLTMPPAIALEELLDRGVLPELFTAFRRDDDSIVPLPTNPVALDPAVHPFASLGSVVADFNQSFPESSDVIDASARLDGYTAERGLHLESFHFASAEELRSFDLRLQEIIPATDSRRRWGLAAPRFFHRERPHRRLAFLTAAELKDLTSGS